MKLSTLSTFLFSAAGVYSAAVPSNARHACQKSLKSCAPGTIVVSQSSHPSAQFSTVQAAIESLPDDNSTQTILILPGEYKEQVNVTRSGPITLLGQTNNPKDATKNKVTLTWAQSNHDNTGQAEDNVFSGVLTVAPTLESSYTGSGPTGYPVPEDTPFGNVDFRAYNIDFTNTWSDYSDGPAHALSFSRANGGFYYCGFYSYQDTVYVGKLGNAYFHKSIIAGQTDFLYGFGTAWIQSSQLLLRNCGGGITAWKGTNTSFVNNYGVYIVDSSVKAANSSIAPTIKGKCALGRPWNSLHRSIFANTYEDESILPAGYIDWVVDGQSRLTSQTFMAEYKAFGPGFSDSGRDSTNASIVLDGRAYKRYDSLKKVFQTPEGKFGNVGWIDRNVD
ncbi:pectin methyl esterase [Aspergillus steynii IBT 23096]|uniref:pectinesterase n=1 Tax=Aspergillus steynii IBT 23096 TaxID=1392250 RepID=A0A2I2GIB1_9EURO|nr:pectin methyl esterase [Aspergillus steynii IBT 23096]PLB52616.1 pectin methyl esterase [Aspergillus steynii IBT 23096]